MDDATGSVVNALFCEQEDSRNYFLLMQNLLRRRGIPLALYTDRHAVFTHRSEYQPTGMPTQFGRAMAELGIQMIFALSPQAKGRVERAAGTFQDRLITELRLAGAITMEQAKAVLKQFLPRYNRRFQVPAQCPDPAFRPLPPDLRLGQVRCFKHKRRVARDNTVKFQRHTLQLLPDRHASAMPVPLSWCCMDWMAGCRYSMRDASLPPRRRPQVQDRCETAASLSPVMPASFQTPKASVNLGKRPPSH